MIWLILISLITYAQTLKNAGISDDVTVQAESKTRNYRLSFSEYIQNPYSILHDLLWKASGERMYIQHIISMVIFSGVVCMFYATASKYIPQNVAFLAAVFFAVHPCNAQIAGWVSGRNYMITLLLGLVALHFNSVAIYIFTFFTISTVFPLPLIMNIPIPIKVLSLVLGLLIAYRTIQTKVTGTDSEGEYKKDNMILYPRKLIVCLKSTAYYFTLALFPLRMGWFHTMGEPIDDKLRRFDRQAVLSILLLLTGLIFIGKPPFLGLALFILFIFPFANLITPALFTSERYMAPALCGWSIFLAFVTVNYPVLAAVIATAYFMRTQLELFAYRDDFSLALYSLINFDKSGFAWFNLVNIFLQKKQPSAAYAMVEEGIARCPEFPTLYYQRYLMYRATDLLFDYNKALDNLEKAYRYGRHNKWYEELNKFKTELFAIRTSNFKKKYCEEEHVIIKNGKDRPVGVLTKPTA